VIARLAAIAVLTLAASAAPLRNWTQNVQLVSVTYAQWTDELATMRGRIVVVDHWATWCAPCVARFPHMMAMSKRWDPKKVAFVTMSLDDRDEPGSFAHVHEFLVKQNARMPNFMLNEIIPDAFEKLSLNGVPAVTIYDATGKQRYRFTGDNPNHQFTDADVEAAIRTLNRSGSTAEQK